MSHQVVHSALTEETGVTKLQNSLGERNEHSQECPFDGLGGADHWPAIPGTHREGEGHISFFPFLKNNPMQSRFLS
jgi:hypothetical protein